MRQEIPIKHSENYYAAWERFHNYWLDEDSPATPLRLLYKELIQTRFLPEDRAGFESKESEILGMIEDARVINSSHREKTDAR